MLFCRRHLPLRIQTEQCLRGSLTTRRQARCAGHQRLDNDFLRAVDFGATLRVFAFAGLRLDVAVAKIAPLLAQVNHL